MQVKMKFECHGTDCIKTFGVHLCYYGKLEHFAAITKWSTLKIFLCKNVFWIGCWSEI
jgi:hypothetical protein